MFKSKILTGTSLFTSEFGVPQGNVLSSLLSNIYFDKLDKEIQQIIDEYEIGKVATKNPVSIKATLLAEHEMFGLFKKNIASLRLKKKLLIRRTGLYPTLLDARFIRVKFVRYADAFIIGVRGPKYIALKIKKRITFFLRSRLQLEINEDKTKLIHVYNDKVYFLGMVIKYVKTKNVPFRKAATIERFRRLKSRIIAKLERHKKRRFITFKELLMTKLQKKHELVGTSHYKKGEQKLLEGLTNLFHLLGIQKREVEIGQRALLSRISFEISKIKVKGLEQSTLYKKMEVLPQLFKEEESSVVPNEIRSLIPITTISIIERLVNTFGNNLGLKVLSRASITRVKYANDIKYYPESLELPEFLKQEILNIRKP